jgi:cell division protein FtsQ
LIWEDEPPEESRFRRVQQVAPTGDRSPSARAGAARSGPSRLGPVAPVNAQDDDFDDLPRASRPRFDEAPPRPWWRPASTFGRVLLALAALIILGGFTTCVLLLRNYLEHDPRFSIAGSSNIAATGLTEVTRSEMLPVFGEDIGRNIFFVPLAERRKQLEQIPWVQSATVMRFLPDQIRVSIAERQPIAFVRTGQQIGLVDANGVLLTMPASMMALHHYSFPVVTGIDGRDPLAGRRARMAVYQRLIADLDSGPQKLSEQISEIDLTDPEDARVLMPEAGADILAHFGGERFLERYQRYKAHIAEWRQQYPKLAEVDLRYDSQVVLKMSPGAGAAQSASVAANSGASLADPASPGKPSPSQPALSAASSATAGQTSASPKSTSKHPVKPLDKKKAAALARKKRADAKRAALNQSKQKPHPGAVQEQ